MMVLSALLEARVLPSGLKVTLVTSLDMASEGWTQGFTTGHIPQDDGLVVIARGQDLAIGTKGHACTLADMASEGLTQGLATGHIPQDVWCRHCPRPGSCHRD